MIEILRKLNALMSPAEQRRAKLVFLLMVGMAIFEMLGVASIMPFISLVANPQVIEHNRYLAFVYDSLGFNSPESFLFFLGVMVLVLFISTLSFKALTTYAIHRFSNMRLHSMACRLLWAYLRQPFVFFLNRNTADLSKSILMEVTQVAQGVLVPSMKLLSGTVVSIAILGLLLFIDPLLSIIVATVLGCAYAIIYIFTRSLLGRIGKDRLLANQQRFILATEALSGIKELRLMGRERAYLERFRDPSERFARHQATNKVIGELPILAIQAVAFGGVLLMILYLMGRYKGVEGAMPLIALYAFAGYRLLPAFQDIFRNLTQLRFALPALDLLYDDLSLKEGKIRKNTRPEPLHLTESIRLESVTYRYPGAESDALSDVSLTTQAGSIIGFVGSTGAGKSTVVDLILGLLEPTHGQILVDGQPLVGNCVAAWQQTLGYVPQSIYLTDDTVAANIAFGIPKQHIDLQAVERAARAAHIDQFIAKELPHGYDTVIGERGIRLSGGERQRLAIARALYHDPDVVVFDEATSALDNATEKSVMEAIKELRGLKTVILIAHRLTTVRECNRIFLLERGKLMGEGSFDELAGNHAGFQKLARAFVA